MGSGETRFGERSDRANSREHHVGSVACYLSTVNYYLNSDYVRTGRRAWDRAAAFGAQLGEVARKEKDLTQRTPRSERRGRGERQEGSLTTADSVRNDGSVGGVLGGSVGMVPRSLHFASRTARRFGPFELRVNGMTGLGPYSFPFPNPSSNLLPQNGQNIIFVPLPALGSSESL